MLPPVVSGAVVMLIGFNLAPVVAGVYWPQDPGVALITMIFTIVAAVAFRGFWSRIAVFLALIFGYLLSWVLDKTVGEITSYSPRRTTAPAASPPTSGSTGRASSRRALVRRSRRFHAPSFQRELHPAGAARASSR